MTEGSGGSAGWNGFVYDGRTADRQPVTVSFEPAGLRVTSADGTSALWPVGELRQTQGSFSSGMLRLEYGTDPVQALFVDQPGFAAALRRAFPGASPALRGHRQTARLIGISMAILAVAIAVYVVAANPMADALARRTPPGWERALGENVGGRLAPEHRQCTDSVGLAAVRGVLGRLVAAGPATPYQFRLVVVRDTTINAFAAPGGFVAVNQGLLQAAKSPEEVAGVLAHEVQHVMHRHSVRSIIREAPIRLVIAFMFDGGAETMANIAGGLSALSYRRSDEAEADRDGMRLMQAASVDDRAMVSFMRTLARENARAPRFVSYLSSHPHTETRVAELEGLVQQGSATTPLMDDATWQRVKRMCDTPGAPEGRTK